MSHTLTKSIIQNAPIIIGGGPIGSSLAYYLSSQKQPLTLIHDKNDLGSHGDFSRLSRLAYDGSNLDLELSKIALRKLKEANSISGGKIISSQPGVLFIASENTALAKRLTESQSQNPGLYPLLSQDLKKTFPFFPISVPTDTLMWFSEDGYVVNPINLCHFNRSMASELGANIIDSRAHFYEKDSQYEVITDKYKLKTKTLFLTAGAQNKEIIENSGLRVIDFQQTYLTAISALRFSIETTDDITDSLMPITVGNLNMAGIDYTLDFSSMPEGQKTLKTRLSGKKGTEVIKYISDKKELDNRLAKSNNIKLFTNLFPKLTTPYDFRRCITYRNKKKCYNGLSFLSVSDSKKKLITTTGCYGVQVKYAYQVADEMIKHITKANTTEGFTVMHQFMCSKNYLAESLCQHRELLSSTGLDKKVGNTPVVQVSDRIYMKLEGENLTQSIKDRTALYVLLKKIESGEIQNGDSLVVATSGSYGCSLSAIKTILSKSLKLKLNLILVTPLSYLNRFSFRQLIAQGYSIIKTDNITHQISEDSLVAVDGPFSKAIKTAEALSMKKSYIYIDQQYDELHMEAHEITAAELSNQMPHVTDIILGTGTGATAMGFANYFKNKKVTLHSRPSESGTIEGLTNPTAYNNFFNATLFKDYHSEYLTPGIAIREQENLKNENGLTVTESTGALMPLARSIEKSNSKAIIAVISPGSMHEKSIG